MTRVPPKPGVQQRHLGFVLSDEPLIVRHVLVQLRVGEVGGCDADKGQNSGEDVDEVQGRDGAIQTQVAIAQRPGGDADQHRPLRRNHRSIRKASKNKQYGDWGIVTVVFLMH